MKDKQLFEKAYSRLLELYGREYDRPHIAVLSRFYSEKAILSGSKLYMRYLDLLSRVRKAAAQKGEHIFVRGTTGASFIAYLLGATDINPLPRHVYCPQCHTALFLGKEKVFEKASVKCSCKAELLIDGQDIPFESNLKAVLSRKIQLCVSHAFFDEAKAMISDELWDKTTVTLSEEELSSVWFCVLDKETHNSGSYALNGNREIFSAFPRITLVPNKTLDKYRELEKATGFKMKEIGAAEKDLAFSRFMECDIKDIPHFDNDFVKGIWNIIKPQSYDDLLKIIGFAHSTNLWKNNAERLFEEDRLSLENLPAFREELYEMINEKLIQNGIYDNGLAYEVADKSTRGHYAKSGGVDGDTESALLDLGFSVDFVGFLSEINYMFTKAQGIAYLGEAVAMMFYKTKFNKEYSEIILEKDPC